MASNTQSTKETVLQASEKLFIKKGFSATSMSMIAREAGVTQSLIHHYFGSKKNLWYEVQVNKFQDYITLEEAILANDDDDIIKVMEESLTTYFRYFQKHPSLGRMLVWTEVEEDDDAILQKKLKPLKNLFDEATEKCRLGQEMGIFRDDVDAQNIMVGFLALTQYPFIMRSYLTTFLDVGPDKPLEKCQDDYLKDMIRFFVAGLRKQ